MFLKFRWASITDKRVESALLFLELLVAWRVCLFEVLQKPPIRLRSYYTVYTIGSVTGVGIISTQAGVTHTDIHNSLVSWEISKRRHMPELLIVSPAQWLSLP